ncbi:MAG: carboxypeptidase-like regulatory domain-containing protein [Flavobacteriaceae bacterium]
MKKQLILIFVFISIHSFSQISLKGVVRDSIGNPLDMANVIAMNVDDGSLEGYSITDAKGNYKIKLSKLGNVELKVSYIGFVSQSKLLVISEEETTKDFVLKEDLNSLDDIEITYTMPVTIKGDTIVYNADSFTNGKEKKLGDVLEKLPGVEVNKEGEIEVEGKRVSKVYVEGKEFFDGDTKLAVKNIPADAIKKVEVLKNHNDVSQMRGVGDDSDNIAINIKLKEGKKNFWFGEVTAGAGEGDGTRYLAHPKLFYYSPNKSINVITDINNIGEIPFTFRDYFKFSGGFKNMMKSGGLNVSSNSLGLSFLKDNKAQEVKNTFGAVNFSQSLSKNLDFNGFAIFSKAENTLQTNSNSTRISQSNTLNEDKQSSTNQDNTLGLMKLALGYKPSAIFQLDYDAILKISDLNEATNTNSLSSFTFGNTTTNSDDNIKSSKAEKPFSIKQSTNMYYTANDKNIFAFESQFLIENNKPLYNSINGEQRFINIPTVDEGTDYNMSQFKKINTRKLDAKLDYYYILNNKSNLNVTLGTTLNTQSLNSNIFQTLDDKSVLDFNNPSLINDVKFNYTDVFVGLHYKLKTGIFTLTPGLSAHQYQTKNTQLGSETKKSPFYLLPDFTAKIQIKRSENIRLNYNISTNFTDINKVSEGVLYNSYNSLSVGNRDLNNALYHKYSLFYSKFNMFSFVNIFGGINYSKKMDVIKNTAAIGLVRINSSLNSIDPDDNLSINARFSKRFKKYKFKISGNNSIANTYRLTTTSLNNVISEKTKYYTQNYKTSLSTNFDTWPNIELGYEISKNDFDNLESSNQKPFANIEVIFLKDFVLTSDYSYNTFTDSNNNTNVYDFLNADLYYQKEGSQWEFKASAINLLNTTSINDDFYSADYRSTSQYIVQPRYLMFTVKYDL